MDKILGIDVGGTGVKGAIVHVPSGKLITEKIRIKTPKPATPGAVIEVIRQLIEIHNWKGKAFGLCFPSVIRHGVVLTASNIDESWIGFKIEKQIKKKLGASVIALNDADSAGLAEMEYGCGKNEKGTVIMLTLGTGIGSGLFYDGDLIPNTEFGHLYYKESIWEDYASNRVRETKELSWEIWATELNTYLNHIEFLFSPDLIILGGGVSKKFEFYKEYIQVKSKLLTAEMLNDAGVIGAAYYASKKLNKKKKKK